MSNGMHESVVGAAQIQDVDESTFERFAQYVYTRSYSAANPTCSDRGEQKRESVNASAVVCPSQENNLGQVDSGETLVLLSDGELPTHPPKMRKKMKKMAQKKSLEVAALQTLSIDAVADPVELELDQMTCIGGIYSRREQDLDQGPGFSYLEHFLSHARLYVFADQRQIDGLATLTASRLEESLQQFHYYDERAEDIVCLVDYIYENTPSLQHGDEKLRAIAVTHVANHVEDLKSSPVFGDLLERGGQFSKDLFSGLAARVVRLQHNTSIAPRYRWP